MVAPGSQLRQSIEAVRRGLAAAPALPPVPEVGLGSAFVEEAPSGRPKPSNVAPLRRFEALSLADTPAAEAGLCIPPSEARER